MKKIYFLFMSTLFLNVAFAQIGTVESFSKISATEGNFTGTLLSGDSFANAEVIGDLDNDGFEDIAIGTREDDDGGTDKGAVWILFLNEDRTVKSYQKISSTEGNFTGVLDNGDMFGSSVTAIGDIDDDGVVDIGVGAWADDDDPPNSGAVWILFMNTDGTVKSHQKISATEGGFTGELDSNDQFGYNTTELGDINNDGVNDIAVGALHDDDGGEDRGAVWILMLNNDGTVKAHQKISSTEGNFSGSLDDGDHFGKYLDHFKTGEKEILVGAPNDDDGGENVGAVWVLDLNANYVSSVKYATNKFENTTIYPNPSADFIYISNEDIKTENAKLQIFDLTGKMLEEVVLKEKIDVSYLKKGFYILRIQSEKQVKIVTNF